MAARYAYRKYDFIKVFNDNYDMVFNVCLRICCNYHTAQDISQDVFLKVHKNLSGFNEESGISTWIYRIAVNTCIDHVRREKKWYTQIRNLFLERNEPSGRFENEVFLKDAGMKILKEMEPNYRAILTLKHYAGFDYREIAQIMNTTEATIGVQLHRARKQAKDIAVRGGIEL
ncbi:MAG: sigma-70 family RNA polymerase sigma factor [Firmicutes bacterium]|nr:sigma-70 family RNA polymerase sigma factor [Bacillota bacterium]